MKNSSLTLALVALIVVVGAALWLFMQQPASETALSPPASNSSAAESASTGAASELSSAEPLAVSEQATPPLSASPAASQNAAESGSGQAGVEKLAKPSDPQPDPARMSAPSPLSLQSSQSSQARPSSLPNTPRLAAPGAESADVAPIGPYDGTTIHGEGDELSTSPEKSETTADIAPPDGKEVITGTVSKGDTAAVLLNTWLPSGAVYSLLEVTRSVYSLAQIHEGQPYTLVRDLESGQMESFEYEIDVNRKLVVQRDGENLEAKVEPIAYDTKLALVSGTITSSLFQAMTDAGEQPALVMILADIYAWEINFIKDLREGDSFSLLVEKRYRDGEFRNYGKVLASSFINQGTAYHAYRFTDRTGQPRFFNAKGESLEKTLLKAPLPVTRVTSGYSMSRMHPIFNVRRPHQGVDYGAPSGTPIRAVGSGVVIKCGWAGGYGKQVILRHSGRLESMYSHMSRYARGMKAGTKVRQGQIIGYVGSTGNATGPHLDFRLMQNGSFVNPSKAINPRVDDLPKSMMSSFSAHMATIRQYLDRSKPLDAYRP